MFDEHRRPWGRLFYLLAFVMVCAHRGVGANAVHHYDQRCRVSRGRNSRGRDTPDLLADVQHGGRAGGSGGQEERDPG